MIKNNLILASAVFFLAGIVFSRRLQNILSGEAVFAVFAVMTGLLLFMFFLSFQRSPALLAAFLLFLFFSGAYHYGRSELAWRNAFEKAPRSAEKVFIEGLITGMPERKLLSSGAYMDVAAFEIRDAASFIGGKELSGKFLLRSFNENAELRPGDIAAFEGLIRAPRRLKNPYGFSEERYLRDLALAGVFTHPRGGLYRKLSEKRSVFIRIKRYLHSLRRHTNEVLEDNLSGDTLAFMKAVLTGERGELKGDKKKIFKRTGTAHMLAVSGLHVGMVGGLFILFLKFLRVPRKLLASAGILFILGYAAFTGGRPSSIRASVMFSVVLIGYLRGEKTKITDSLAIAAGVIAYSDPAAVFSGGFVLSFCAVVSIILITPVTDHFFMPRFLKKSSSIAKAPIRFILKSVSVSFAVWLGLLPLLAHYFALVSFASFFCNLLALSGLFILISSGIVLSFFANFTFLEKASGLISWFIDKVYLFIQNALSVMAETPFSWTYVTDSGPLFLTAYYALLAAFLLFFAKTKRKSFIALVFVLLAGNLLVWGACVRELPKEMRLTIFDVGKADASVLEFPGGEVFLIDGGSGMKNHGEEVVAGYLRRKGVRVIDGVFLTHAHEDHMGGLFYVLRSFKVKKFFSGGIAPLETGDKELYAHLRKKLSDKGIPYIEIKESAFIELPSGGSMSFFNPSPGRRYRNLNNASLVMKLDTPSAGSVLFCGDAEEEAILNVLRFSGHLDSNIMKAPHHGQNIASKPVLKLFLENVSPEAAVVTNKSSDSLSASFKETLEAGYVRMHVTGEEGYYMKSFPGRPGPLNKKR